MAGVGDAAGSANALRADGDVSDHPFVARLRALPENFPELAGGDMLARTARMVILPQMVRAAAKAPDEFRATAVRFIARFVVALDVAPSEIFFADAAADAAKAPATIAPADRTDPTTAPTLPSPLAPAESENADHAPPARDLSKILAGE